MFETTVSAGLALLRALREGIYSMPVSSLLIMVEILGVPWLVVASFQSLSPSLDASHCMSLSSNSIFS